MLYYIPTSQTMKTRRQNRFKKRTAKILIRGGTITTKIKYKDGSYYYGEVNARGEKHGKGRMVEPDGYVYDGDWKKDKRDGHGTYGTDLGYDYEGEFKNDNFHGHGIYIDRSNRITYRGEFANGKRNGMGYLTTTSAMGHGTTYGEFVDDVFVKGTGTRCFKHVKEEGEFEKENLVKGKKYRSDHIIEEGDFENGEIINGKTTWPDGGVYVGTYDENGLMHGEGTCIWRGATYQGEYQHGKMSGFGIIRYPSGNVYEGQFKNDKKDGMGKLTLPNGTTTIGRFHEGEPSPDAVVLSARVLSAQAAQNSIFTELGPAGRRVFSITHSRRPSRK